MDEDSELVKGGQERDSESLVWDAICFGVLLLAGLALALLCSGCASLERLRGGVL